MAESTGWLDKPTGHGFWWVVHPDQPDVFYVATTWETATGLAATITGLNGSTHWNGVTLAHHLTKGFKWRRAELPTYP